MKLRFYSIQLLVGMKLECHRGKRPGYSFRSGNYQNGENNYKVIVSSSHLDNRPKHTISAHIVKHYSSIIQKVRNIFIIFAFRI